jgi:PAS domain S-box-containing protein/putative nucleotidyltransferase with HDIG domain
MKKQQANKNGAGLLKSQAEKFLVAKHGKLESISRVDAKKLVHELQMHQIQLKNHAQELLRVQMQLQQERGLAQRYLEVAGVMIAVLNHEGRIILINKKGCDILGYGEGELVGRTWFELCPPGDLGQDCRSVFSRLLAGDLENTKNSENAVLTKDGRKRLIAFNNTLLRDQYSQIAGILFSGEDITERRQAEAALRQSEKELTIRNRIAQIFLTILDDAIYEAVLKVVLEAANSKYGAFGYIEENGALVIPSVTHQLWDRCEVDSKHLVFPQGTWGDSIWPRAIRERRALCANEPCTLTLPGHIPIERCLAVPLRYFENVIGILIVANKEMDYDDQDIRCMEMIADTIAPILNARLQKTKQEKGREWAEEALRLAAHKWRTTFDAIGDAVCLLDPDGRILQCNQAVSTLTGKSFDTILGGPCCKSLHGATHPLENCPLARMTQSLRREELILSVDNRWLKETVDPIMDEAGALIGGVHLTMDITTAKNAEAALRESEGRFRAIFDQAAVGVALVETSTGRYLKVNQKLCNILGLTSEEMTATTFQAITYPDDLPVSLDNMQKLRDGVVQSFSREKRYCRKDGSPVWVNLTISAMREADAPSKHHIAVVQDITQRRQAEFEVRQGLDKLRLTLSGTVGALANTVETKDPYTAGHQRRVAQLACAIARELRLPPDQVEGMHVLSFLHDIGKIAVPAEILSRPGKISDIEINLIRTHPEVGYNILKDIEFPWPVAQAILQHHERLDGSGYPAGLTGEEIIQEARILAVADVVEAMASHRPYRPALGIEAALAEIVKYQGKLFDSQVVTACVQLFEKKDFDFL